MLQKYRYAYMPFIGNDKALVERSIAAKLAQYSGKSSVRSCASVLQTIIDRRTLGHAAPP